MAMLGTVASAIDRFAVPMTLLRTAAGAFDDAGHWVEGDSQSIPIMAAIFAMTPDAVAKLPEGIRGDVTRRLWTRTEILAPDDANGVSGDRIDADGMIFRVLWVENRGREGGYWTAYLGEIQDRGRGPA